MPTGDATALAEDRLLDEYDVALVTALSVSKVRKLRMMGDGPPFVKLGTHRRASVRYSLRDLRDWIQKLERK